MKARLLGIGCAALLVFPVVACSGAEPGEDGTSSVDGAEVDDLDGKADGVTKPIGTYQLAKPSTVGSKDLTLLVLKTDKTYHAEQAVECVTHPCDPVGFDGTYKFTKSTTSGKRYIKLEDGTRYEYKLSSGGKLSLRVAGTTPWFEMVRATEAWCGEPTDCTLQNIPQPKCPGEWQCEANTCAFYECSAVNDCEAAGGSCVALTPTSCQDGVVGSAGEYSCGGAVGVMCCLPKPEPPVCKHVGTSEEGWYREDGTKICAADCAGHPVQCSAVGSKSEGWYTDAGHGCIGASLIGWDNCG